MTVKEMKPVRATPPASAFLDAEQAGKLYSRAVVIIRSLRSAM
jgi:hypothetical protein